MNKSKPVYSFHPDDLNCTAASVARFALTGGSDVLDIGSGRAGVSRYLATEHGRNVTCVDNDTTALSSVAEAGLRTVEADIENDDLGALVAGSGFDVVLLADVLPSVRDPQQLLTRLLAGGLLRRDGILVISVPNAAHESVISELLVGDFRYAESGLLDHSHVCWFTLESLQRLLERAGFLIDRVDRTTRILETTHNGERALDISDSMRRAINELNEDSEVYQYVVRAVVDSGATRMARDRQGFEDERRSWAGERDELRRETTRLRAQLERVSSLLREERTAFAAELKLGAAELDARDREIARFQEQCDDLIRERNEARRAVRASLYEDSRGVRVAARVVRRIRKIRGPRG